MKRYLYLLALLAACSFFAAGCTTGRDKGLPAVVKKLTSVSVDSNSCTVTICGVVKLGDYHGVPQDTTVHVYLGDAGMTVEELLAAPASFLVKSTSISASSADADGCADVCCTITLPPGKRPVLVRAETAAWFGSFVAAGLVEGVVPSTITDLSCRVIGVDVVLEWSSPTPVHADEIMVLLRPGAESEQSTTLPGDATTLTIEGALSASISDVIRLIATNKYGSTAPVDCVVKRPGTPRVLCQLIGDKIVLTWDSEALSVELFENGESLGYFEGSGTTELCDRDPGTYVYTAVGTGLEEQPLAVSDVSEPCELHRKIRLLLTQCEEDVEYYDTVARVLVDGAADLPVFFNAKVLTLALEEQTEESDLRFEAEPFGSSSFFDVFFDVDIPDTDQGGAWDTEIVSMSLNGVDLPFTNFEGQGYLAEPFLVDEPGPIDVEVVLQGERLIEVVTGEGEEQVVGLETEIISMSLIGTALFTQTATPLFGNGSDDLRLEDSSYADAFLDPSNAGNRLNLVTRLVHGYGYGRGSGEGYNYIGTSGYNYINTSGNNYIRTSGNNYIHASGTGYFYDSFTTRGHYSDGFSVYGRFYDNDLHTHTSSGFFGHNHYTVNHGHYENVTLYGSTSGYVYSNGYVSGYIPLRVSGWNHINTDGYNYIRTSGNNYIRTSDWNWIRVNVNTDVNVWTPVLVEDGVSAPEATFLAGHHALGAPDSVGFGLGREAAHISTAFCDNIILDGPGPDLRIFVKMNQDETDAFHMASHLDKFFNIKRETHQGNLPSWDSGKGAVELPADDFQDTTALGYTVFTREESSEVFGYSAGHIIDVDLGLLGIDCLNTTTLISDGEGSLVDHNFDGSVADGDIFAGANIDALCGLNNLFGLRVCPVESCEEEVAQRDLFVGDLFDSGQEYYYEYGTPWKYVLCSEVFCDGIKSGSLSSNEVQVSSGIHPAYMQMYLKQEGISNLADAADEADEDFGLGFVD